jgi:hypothetical protein
VLSFLAAVSFCMLLICLAVVLPILIIWVVCQAVIRAWRERRLCRGKYGPCPLEQDWVSDEDEQWFAAIAAKAAGRRLRQRTGGTR